MQYNICIALFIILYSLSISSFFSRGFYDTMYVNTFNSVHDPVFLRKCSSLQ